jgi:ribosomal protein S18 acetylase RimI-like enzyme
MDTGPDFREEHVLANGTKVVIRHIQPSDAAELRRGFQALSPESRYRRFFGSVADLDDATLKYLTNVDGKDHVAIVAVIESLDLKTERGIGVARFVRVKDEPTVAEVAVTVVDDMQQIGVGTLLTKALAHAARERGIEKFRCEVLESNDLVVHALRDAGGVEVERGSGAVVLDVPVKDSSDTFIRKALRVTAEHMPAFLRRLLPPAVVGTA